MSKQLALSAIVSTLALGALALASPRIEDRAAGLSGGMPAVADAPAELPSIADLIR